jgi:hypothetical protein
MAKVSREILKSFFQSGSKPTSAHFNFLIDSLLHFSDDKDSFGLKDYQQTGTYNVGDTIIYNSNIYQANKSTTGTFTLADWNLLGTPTAPPTAIFGSDYQMVEDEGTTYTSSTPFITKLTLSTQHLTGTYRIQWSALVHHGIADGTGSFQLLDTTNNAILGGVQVISQTHTNNRLPVGGTVLLTLNGTTTDFAIQFNNLADVSNQYIEQARIEIFRVA